MKYDVIVEVNTVDCIVEVEKFNPYHDAKGRFASADSATSFTYAPGKSKAHDLAIAREKERTAATAPQRHANGSSVSLSAEDAFARLDKMGTDYVPYARGQISKVDAGQLYKAVKNGHAKALPETIKLMYDSAKSYIGTAGERYRSDPGFYDDVSRMTKALLNGDYEVAQFFINRVETDCIARAGKKSPYYKYRD